MTHILEGRLKVVVEEANKEKALKQVFKSILQKKVLELALMELKAAAVEKARDSTERKVRVLEGKLGDFDSKLAQVESVVLAFDKGLADLKEMMKQSEQTFYNLGFINAENSCSLVILEARRQGFA